MSELIAFVFRDQYRAPEVLNELRRRDWPWVRDLDDAVVITLAEDGRARVHLTVDLSTYAARGWARLWGTLLNSTLFLPQTEEMVEAANGFGMTAQSLRTALRENSKESLEAKWWRESLESSGNFKRDVAALMSPHGSAIFMLVRAANAPVVLKQLGNYGDTIVHTSVSSEQDIKMLDMLATS